MKREKFKMYTDWAPMIDAMTNSARGELLMAIFEYENNRELSDMSDEAKVAFASIKPTLDRDIETNFRGGESHWNWKGGVTPKNRADRNCAAYKQFRRAVLERDNYTCQICGQTGGKLNVHHIKSFADNEDLRFDPDNGITLCEKCHKEVHKNARQHDIL